MTMLQLHWTKLLSIGLGLLAIWLGVKIVPKYSSTEFTALHVERGSYGQMDPNVYLYEEGSYHRIGRVTETADTFVLNLLNEELGCDCAVVIARPSLWQFVRMQSEEDRAILSNAVSEIVAENVRRVFALTSDDAEPIRKMLGDAFSRALEDPAVRGSQDELVELLNRHINPHVMEELRAILLARIAESINVVVADATENYGLDLVRGRFELAPIPNAVDYIFADPHVQILLRDKFADIASDEELVHAAEGLILAYMNSLFDGIAALPERVGDGSGRSVEEILDDYFGRIERLIYKDDAAHPVVLAMARSLFVAHRGSSEGVFVVLPIAEARTWFPPDAILQLETESGNP